MNDIIKAMRVLAEELEADFVSTYDGHSALFMRLAVIVRKSANRLERESKNPGAEEM